MEHTSSQETMSLKRPLSGYSTLQLEQYFAEHGDARPELDLLIQELRLRSRKSASTLLQRVARRLDSLAASHSPSGKPNVRHESTPSEAVGDTSHGHIAKEESPVSFEWDASQLLVIGAAPDARQVVDAGPGTGKTAVACARVASLIAAGVEASNIWLISFTRTAVQELRNRIRALVENDQLAGAVRITTLDSHAWRMVAGFEAEGVDLFSGYDGTISGAIGLLKHPTDEVAEYLRSVEHLLVDEAQDLVGLRADLIELLVNQLPSTAGVTILCDDAQAIYGFAEFDARDSASLPFNRRLAAGCCEGFHRTRLTTVHRTNAPGLHMIFTETRSRVLSPVPNAQQKFRRVREDILGYADGRVGKVTEQSLAGREDTLVLFRRRVEVMMASSYLWSDGVSHRIRMSGLPSCLPFWIATVLWDYDSRWLTRSDFQELFRTRTSGADDAVPAIERAWQLLLSAGGTQQSRIDMHLLRARLSSSRPPVDLCSHELGRNGPIIGTIHASKGRESGEVHLMLPEEAGEMEGDIDEETRILYVGATRARNALRTGDGFPISAGATESSKRCFRCIPRKTAAARAQVEIGRDGDIDLRKQVSESLFSTQADAIASQAALRRLNVPFAIRAWSVASDGFTYHLRAGDEPDAPIIGALSSSVNYDLFEISRMCGAGSTRVRLPSIIRHIRCIGVRTVAISVDDPVLPTLHAPFCDTGLYLAPVITGFTSCYFNKANTR